LPLRGFGDDESDVVVLLVRAEAANFVDDGCEELLRRETTVPMQGGNEALFAELFASLVEGFRDAVGVEGEGIARAKSGFADGAVPVFEDAEDRGGGLEAFERIVAVEQEGRKVATVGVAQPARGAVIFGEKESGEGAVGGVFAKELVDGT